MNALNPAFAAKLRVKAAKAVEEEMLCNVGEEGYPADVWKFLRKKGDTPMYKVDGVEPLADYAEWTASMLLANMETMRGLLYENMVYAVNAFAADRERE